MPNCSNCGREIPLTSYSLSSDLRCECRSPVLTNGQKLIEQAKWLTIIRHVAQVSNGYEGFETAAPPLEEV